MDITERKRKEEEIRHLAYHDSLTGLPNRSLLIDRLQQALVTARRHQHIGALLFIDLDDFKKINDSLGHPVGDIVLKEVANRITSHLRAEDTVARLGGDEFVVLLPFLSKDLDDATQRADDLAEKLRQLIGRPMNSSSHQLQVTASIGVVLFPDANENVHELIRFADTAMYQAKADGRNAVTRFEKSMADKVNRALTLESQLRTAKDNDEFYLQVQPQYRGPNKLIGAELLMRWNSPSMGPVSPAEFIPILETTGLIYSAGEWLLKTACTHIRRWLDQDLWDESLSLGVNISPTEFRQADVVERIARILNETGIPPTCINLEITEGTVIHNIDEIIVTLKALRELGVQISVDDFGTGYSSLTYLKRLPIDTVKIDQSFIHDIPGDSDAEAIVKTVITMANHLNLQVIAEGVESLPQMQYLQSNNCHDFQGFFFNRPMDIDLFETLLVESAQ